MITIPSWATDQSRHKWKHLPLAEALRVHASINGGLSQAAHAEALELASSVYSEILKGKRGVPRSKRVAIAKQLGVPESVLDNQKS